MAGVQKSFSTPIELAVEVATQLVVELGKTFAPVKSIWESISPHPVVFFTVPTMQHFFGNGIYGPKSHKYNGAGLRPMWAQTFADQ